MIRNTKITVANTPKRIVSVWLLFLNNEKRSIPMNLREVQID